MESFSHIPTHSIVGHGLIAVFGGAVHSLNAHRMGQTKGIWDIIVLSIISSFCGIIFSLIALYFFDNQYITLACAGCGGYLGTEGLSVIAEKVRDVLVKKVE